jgi:hypothetical protein
MTALSLLGAPNFLVREKDMSEPATQQAEGVWRTKESDG